MQKQCQRLLENCAAVSFQPKSKLHTGGQWSLISQWRFQRGWRGLKKQNQLIRHHSCSWQVTLHHLQENSPVRITLNTTDVFHINPALKSFTAFCSPALIGCSSHHCLWHQSHQKTENCHCTCEKPPALSSSSLWPSSAQIPIQFQRLPTQHLQRQR